MAVQVMLVEAMPAATMAALTMPAEAMFPAAMFPAAMLPAAMQMASAPLVGPLLPVSARRPQGLRQLPRDLRHLRAQWRPTRRWSSATPTTA